MINDIYKVLLSFINMRYVLGGEYYGSKKSSATEGRSKDDNNSKEFRYKKRGIGLDN